MYRNSDGVRRTMITNDLDPGLVKVNTELNLDEILRGIERDRELQDLRGANRLLARVPMTVMEQSIHENWTEEQWARWLNDPQNEPFRVWKGRV